MTTAEEYWGQVMEVVNEAKKGQPPGDPTNMLAALREHVVGDHVLYADKPGTQKFVDRAIKLFSDFREQQGVSLSAVPSPYDIRTFLVHLSMKLGSRRPDGKVRAEYALAVAKKIVEYNLVIHEAVFAFPEDEYARLYRTTQRLVQKGKLYAKTDEKIGKSKMHAIKDYNTLSPEVGLLAMHHIVCTNIYNSALHGTWSWDLVVYESMVLVLYHATGLRPGDMAVSAGYPKDTCLHWGDINLVLNGAPLLKNLQCRIVFKHVKGQKGKKNTALTREFTPLLNHPAICPIQCLLNHAIRNGLVNGTSLNDVLQKVDSDSRVVWTHKDWPVLCSIDTSSKRCLKLNEPVGASQPTDILQKLGVAANVSGNLTMRGVRNAAIVEFSMSKEKTFDGAIVSKKVSAVRLMHSKSSLDRGITARQTGSMALDMLQPRLETATYSRVSPIQFSTECYATYFAQHQQQCNNEAKSTTVDNNGKKSIETAQRQRSYKAKFRSLEEYRTSNSAPFPAARLENGCYLECPLSKNNTPSSTNCGDASELNRLLYDLCRKKIGEWTRKTIQQLNSIVPMTPTSIPTSSPQRMCITNTN